MTPRFDERLTRHFATQAEGWRTCAETGEHFFVSRAMIDMYRRLGVPVPTVCPRVRFRRQRQFIGGMDLFRREINGETIITMFDPESPAIVWTNERWRSDAFDELSYGRDYDASRSFFDQWTDFSRSVPRSAIANSLQNEGSGWSIYGSFIKNCYFTYGGIRNDGLAYADFAVACSHSMDTSGDVRGEWSYETVECVDCSHVYYSERCSSCLNVIFSLGCQDCADCFGCANLKHKKFYFLNQPLSESEYREKIASMDFGDAAVVERLKKEIREKIWSKAVRRSGINIRSENSYGDSLLDSEDTIGASLVDVHHGYHVFDVSHVRDACDVSTSTGLERAVNVLCCEAGYDVRVIFDSDACTDVEYSEYMVSCDHCFGCIGLRHKKFCILNKQYEETEYWKLVDAIKSDMMDRGDYGNFFPVSSTPFAYNASGADVLYPLMQTEAEAIGGRWYDFGKERSVNALPIDRLPTRLSEAADEILTQTFACPVSGRAFRITKTELEFHRQFNLALPRLHPTVRRKERLKEMLPFDLHERTCAECGKKVLTRYPSDFPSKIVCSECFEKVMLGEIGV